ncbi:MAG: germination protein YpeB [Clostridiales bacterium]|nr:germination protein YpeB [Clostridiales bacterium]
MTISSKRNRIRLASFIISGFVALLALAGINIHTSNLYKREINLENQRALTQLSAYMDNIDMTLTKGLYSGTPEKLSEVSSSLWRETTCAKSSLSEIDLSDIQMEKTYKFLSQVSDYALFLSKKSIKGEEMTDEEYNNLVELESFAASLSEQISSIVGYLNDGALDFPQVSKALANVDDIGSLNLNLSSAMNDTEQTLTDYPTLIYDGPFSDHLSQLMPKMTLSAQPISQNQALNNAADFLCLDATSLSFKGETGGNMPCYNFSDGKKINISVTKDGGFVVYTLNSRYAGEAVLSIDEATKKALSFLAEKGITDMVRSYYAINDGIATINFAYKQDEVICYPDLIKVSVALDNGDILSFDAINYLMNHCRRNIVAPKLTIEQAKNSVSKNLSIKSTKLAIIPTDSADEKYCYEFLCQAKNSNDVLVYINAQTGAEEEILLLLYSDNGVFTK